MEPSIRLVVEPTQGDAGFRYSSEAKKPGCKNWDEKIHGGTVIVGQGHVAENPVYPTLQVANFTGNVTLTVSCISRNPLHEKYFPHPYQIVGEGTQNGIFRATLVCHGSLLYQFKNLKIRSVKKKYFRDSLNARKAEHVDPFSTGYSFHPAHKSMDMRCLRLAFEATLHPFPVGPQVHLVTCSKKIFNSRQFPSLKLVYLSPYAIPVLLGDNTEKFSMVLLTSKIYFQNIKIVISDGEGWETEISNAIEIKNHHNYALRFTPPPYKDVKISEAKEVEIKIVQEIEGWQLESDIRKFEYKPMVHHPEPAKRKRAKQDNFKVDEFLDSFETLGPVASTASTSATRFPQVPTPPNTSASLLQTSYQPSNLPYPWSGILAEVYQPETLGPVASTASTSATRFPQVPTPPNTSATLPYTSYQPSNLPPPNAMVQAYGSSTSSSQKVSRLSSIHGAYIPSHPGTSYPHTNLTPGFSQQIPPVSNYTLEPRDGSQQSASQHGYPLPGPSAQMSQFPAQFEAKLAISVPRQTSSSSSCSTHESFLSSGTHSGLSSQTSSNTFFLDQQNSCSAQDPNVYDSSHLPMANGCDDQNDLLFLSQMSPSFDPSSFDPETLESPSLFNSLWNTESPMDQPERQDSANFSEEFEVIMDFKKNQK